MDLASKLAAMLATGLMVADEEDVPYYAKKRLKIRDKQLVSHVVRVREMMLLLASALQSADEQQVEHVRRTHTLLTTGKLDASAPDASAPALGASAPDASALGAGALGAGGPGDDPSASGAPQLSAPPSSAGLLEPPAVSAAAGDAAALAVVPPALVGTTPDAEPNAAATSALSPIPAAVAVVSVPVPTPPPRVGAVAQGSSGGSPNARSGSKPSPWAGSVPQAGPPQAGGPLASMPAHVPSPPMPVPSSAVATPNPPSVAPAISAMAQGHTTSTADVVNATVDVEAVQIDQADRASAALPFHQSPDPSQPVQSMAIEGYAALCAMCAEFPDSTDAMNARFQVMDASSRQRLDQRWKDHLAHDAHDNELFGMLFHQFRQWLRLHGRAAAP